MLLKESFSSDSFDVIDANESEVRDWGNNLAPFCDLGLSTYLILPREYNIERGLND